MADGREPTAAPRAALALVLALTLATATASAAAQTRFAWPDTTVDVTKYTTADLCLAAVSRTQGDLSRREVLTAWRDTMPLDPSESLKPLPAPATEAAARCAARFPEATAKLADFAPLLELYLMAGRNADASALVARRLAAVRPKDKSERSGVEDTTIGIYLEARPVRLDEAERILVARAHEGGTDRMDRMEIYSKLMTDAKGAGDTARTRRAARWIVAVADSLTPAERESDKFQEMNGGGGGQTLVFKAVQELLGLRVMLDSLRHGTAALVALERNTWATQFHQRPETLPIPIGDHAPTITADYWIPAVTGNTPRPTPGHVSLFIFLDDKDCLGFNPYGEVQDECGSELAMLRRMSRRFPTLDITIMSSTHGFFVYAPPMTPAEEVEMLRKWLEPYHIPRLTVAVSATPFWNLPSPDGRRIEKPTANFTNYSFRKKLQPDATKYLVDQDGLIVSAFGQSESDLVQFIDVLMHRQTGGEHAAN